MARRRRRDLGTGFFHVINRSARKEPLFQRARDYRAFINVLNEGLTRHPVRLLAYAVMTNHWHLVVGPVDPDTLSRLLHWVTATHAIRWRRYRQTTGHGPVYQGRFKSEQVTEVAELVRVCRYVERNALRANLVSRAQDWPWSSLAQRLGLAAQPPLVPAPFLSSAAWIDHVNAALTPLERLARPGTKHLESVENRHVPLDHFAEEPGGSVGSGEARQQRSDVLGGTDNDHADPHVEGPEHLFV